MVNHFEVDDKQHQQETIKKVIKDLDPEEGRGGATKRYYLKKDVFKVMRHKKGEISIEITASNAKKLLDLGIDIPDTTVGEYDLRDVGMWKQTPVIIQERADRDLTDTFHKGKATEETLLLLEGAIEIVDIAYEAGIVLDNSLHNFGLFGKWVVFLDFQDNNSLKKGSQRELKNMYDALIRSLRGRIPEKGKDPEQILRENSRVVS